MNTQTPKPAEASQMAIPDPVAMNVLRALSHMDLTDLPFHLRRVHDHVLYHSAENLDLEIRTSMYFVNELAMAIHGKIVFAS